MLPKFKKLFFSWIVFLFCFIFSFQTAVWGAENASIIETYLDGDKISVFVSGIDDIKDVQGYIASEPMLNIHYGKLSESNIPMKTLFLLDTSLSVRESEQEQLKEILKKMIDEKSENESFAIAVFGKEISYLCDYETDRWELMKVLDEIKPIDQESYCSEVLLQAVNEFNKITEEVFCRIIMFSDGGDLYTNGITLSELHTLFQNSPYPVYTLGCEYDANAEGLQELFSVSRITNAESILFTEESEVDEIVNILHEGIECFRILADIPESVQDGGIKNLSLKINTGKDTVELNLDVRVNMRIDTGSEEPKDEKAVDAVTSKIKDVLQKNVWEKIKPYRFYILPGGAAFAVIVIGILLFKKVIKKKKGKRKEQEQERAYDTTMCLERSDIETEDRERTQCLFAPVPTVCIRLKDIENNRIFEKEITERITIGRTIEKNDIGIPYEASISGQHCFLYLKGVDVYIEDNDSSNHTYVNDEMVKNSVRIRTGDTIKLGKAKFEVTIS